MEVLIAILVVHSLVSAGFSAYVADEKHRDGYSWFWLGLIFGVLAMIAIVGLPSAEPERVCPSCMKNIYDDASICPHCQHELPVRKLPARELPARVLVAAEKCAYHGCSKVMSPKDERSVDSEDNVYCSRIHRDITEMDRA